MIDIKNSLDLKRRYFKDSGYLNVSNSTAILSGQEYIFFLDPRFTPYDDVSVINLDTANDSTITINYNFNIPLPHGTQIEIKQLTSQISVKNIGSTTIAINGIQINYRNTGYKGQEGVAKLKALSGFAGIIRGLF